MSDDQEKKDSSDQLDEAQAGSEAPAVAEPMESLDADAVIEAFGGIRPMASKLEVAVSTVQGWKARSHIPDNRWRDIIAAAGAHGIDLSGALKREEVSEPEAAAPEDTVDAEEQDAAADEAEDTTSSPWQSDAEESAEAAPEQEADPEPQPKQTPEPAAAAAAPASSGKSGGGGLTLFLAVVAIAGVVTRPVWAPYVDPHLGAIMPSPGAPTVDAGGDPALSDAINSVSASVSELSDRISDLEERPIATGSDDGDGASSAAGAVSERLSQVETDLSGRLSALETDLSALSESAAALEVLRTEMTAALEETENALQGSLERDEESRARLVERLGVLESRLRQIAEEAENATASLAGLTDRIDGHEADITALEERPALEAAAQAGLALAVGDVESAIADGRPFASAVERLSGLAPAGTDIASAAAELAPFGEAGVPTRAALHARFEVDAPAMQSELGRVQGDALETLLDGARSLISVRRTGESPDAPPVSRAEAALDRGDLASAIAALAPVRDQSETVAAWLADAEARLGVEAALSSLRGAVGALLSGAPEANGDDG